MNKYKDIDEIDNLVELTTKLRYAKESVRWLLDNESGSVDFHGLSYWAGEVERLQAEIKKSL